MNFQITEFKSILELLQKFPDEKTCIQHLENVRWNGNIVSPFDATSKVYRCAGNKYKCKNTGKYFNVRIGTIFEDTKIPLQKWFMAMYLVVNHKKGISSYQLARDLGITQKTSWFMLHRIRYTFGHEIFQEELKGIVEVDETYLGGKEKNKHANKRYKNNQGRSAQGKQVILGMVQRQGHVKAFKVEDSKGSTIQPVIVENVVPKSILITDEWKGYNGIGKHYNHATINHKQGEYVRGYIYTNTIENYWSVVKRTFMGVYNKVNDEHVQVYLNEFSFRYNHRANTSSQRFHLPLQAMEGRLTYKKLVNDTK